MSLKHQLISRALICLSLTAHFVTAEAAGQVEKPAQTAIAKPIVVTKDMRAALQQFVRHYAGDIKSKPQHIYVASVKNEGGENILYAYWKEDQSILMLSFFSHPSDDHVLSWLHRKARVDLKTGVVPTEAEMNGSTYLVTKAWADNIVHACLNEGQVLVFRNKPGRNK